jgi:hypothetical protein
VPPFLFLIYTKNQKVEKQNFFPVVFSLRFVFIAFLAVSLMHEELKNTTNMFFKKTPRKSHVISKKVDSPVPAGPPLSRAVVSAFAWGGV